jgi:hypothetical protein
METTQHLHQHHLSNQRRIQITASVFQLAVLFVLPHQVISASSWEQEQCLNLYGASPLGSQSIPITKIDWDNKQIVQFMDPDVIGKAVETWPEPMESRHTSGDFFNALGTPKPTPNSVSLSYAPTTLGGNSFTFNELVGVSIQHRETLTPYDEQYVVLDEEHRCIYVSNLKAGSTTIGGLMKRSLISGRIYNCHNDGKPRSRGWKLELNETIERVNNNECDGKCRFTCSKSQLHTTDLPDELLEKYLVFSFGKFVRLLLLLLLSFFFFFFFCFGLKFLIF